MAPPRRRTASMVFILVTLFLDILGIGLMVPVLPHLVTHFTGGDASQAAAWYGLIASSYAAAQFVFAPVLGSLSDRFGRRPVLLVSLFGFGVNYLILGLAPSLAWLFVARIMSGVCGASFTTANAYIADISTPTNRAQNFGLVGAAFGLGFIFGPALGGILGHIGTRVPFFVSAGLVLINWLYGYFILPESLPPDQRRGFSWREASPLTGLKRLRRYRLVAGLAVAFVFFSLAQRGLENVWVLYTDYRFGWQELENGLALALIGVMAAIVQGGLIRRVVPRIGERRAVVIGLTISTVGFVLYGLASEGWMLLCVIVFASLGGIAGPAIQGLVAGSVPSSEQGGVQGSLTSLVSLTSVVAPLIASQLFTTFTGDDPPIELPGIPFFAGAIFMVAALVAVLRAFRRNPEIAGGPIAGATAAAEPSTADGDAASGDDVG